MRGVVARSTFPNKNAKNTTCWRHFWTLKRRFVWQAQGILHPAKSEQSKRVLQHFQKRWQAWDFWRGSAKMYFTWQAHYERHMSQTCQEVRALISWGCIFEHQLLRFGKVILRDRCTTWHLASLSRGTRNTLDRWNGKIAKTQWYEAASFALSFPNFGSSLAELLRFWCCQLRKLKKSCRIVSFSSLQIDRETDR